MSKKCLKVIIQATQIDKESYFKAIKSKGNKNSTFFSEKKQQTYSYKVGKCTLSHCDKVTPVTTLSTKEATSKLLLDLKLLVSTQDKAFLKKKIPKHVRIKAMV